MRYETSLRRKMTQFGAVVILLSAFESTHAGPTTLFSDDFEAKGASQLTLGAQAGGAVAISTDASRNYLNSAGSLKGSYPVSSGNVYVWGIYDVSKLNLEEIYVEFWAKMPGAKQGLKFLKIFGAGDASHCANTTFALDYTGGDNGQMHQVSFGDGSGTGNDTANVINFDGSDPEMIGRSYKYGAVVSTPQKSAWASSNWNQTWHHFRFHVKFNSGTSAQTEKADGAYFVEIDGKVYVQASGIFNRHYTNQPIDRIELFGWAQGGSAPFEIWYDNVTISTGGFIGTTTQPPSLQTIPQPPSSLLVK